MRIRLSHLLFVLLLTLLGSAFALGQVSSTAPLSGSVVDPTGAVIANADVTVKNNATGAEYKAVTNTNGTFTIPALSAGNYSVTVAAHGFKQAIVPDVKLDVGTPASVNVALEVGAASESVVIQSGGEVLQTQSANVSTTITGRQITELPFTSRDALDLVLLLPGTSTPGRPRTSTVNGLPKGSLNITLDGINAQDNLGKSSDGFFTYIRPRIDAVDEVTVSTATPGAESAGEGAVQIKFVTRGGTNEYRGSLYEYHRNPALNANYWFNNRDSAPDPRTGKAPRDRILLNQFGGRVGGPITVPGLFRGKDKAFFFLNYEEYRLPEQVSRQRGILSTAAQTGLFTYTGSAGVKQVNLLTLAANTANCAACTGTVDPSIAKILGDIRGSVSKGAVQALDANRDQFTFTNTGGQTRRFATVRFDFNLTSKHHLENIWNYQVFRNKVDILNSADPAFPGLLSGIGGQNSNRFSNATALRSTLTSSLVNEARFGVQSGTSLFRGDSDNSSPAGFANQNGFSFGANPGTYPNISTTALGFQSAFPTATGFNIANPVASRSSSRRNSPVYQFTDNVSYLRGNHSLSFGGTFSQLNS
ncbi:MAG: carboxypeptidase-like regulatory domain-containing protein, partial [Blastocatellia bacterium]